MTNGKHTVIVRAWDTSGAYGDQTLSLTVGTLVPFVTVFTPINTANVGAPVNIQAAASPTAGHTISGWGIYVDGSRVFKTGAVNAIHTNINAGVGSHAVLVRAWDSSGAYGDQVVTPKVSPVAVNVSTPLHDASVSSPVNIQAAASSANTITGMGCLHRFDKRFPAKQWRFPKCEFADGIRMARCAGACMG